MDKPTLSTEKAFNALSIFDWGFRSFITVKLVKVLYILGIALFTLGAIIGFFFSMSQGVGIALAILPMIAIMYVIAVLSLRLYLELIVVLFRIAENTTTMARRLEGSAQPEPVAVLD